MKTITNSLNDMTSRRAIRSMTNGIEKINLTRGKELDCILIDSYLHDTIANDNSPSIHMMQDPPTSDTVLYDGKDKDNPNTHRDFDGSDWNKDGDGRWIPPEDDGIICNLHGINSEAQSDSGANRIVTDNLKQMINIKMIDPLAMGSCNKEDAAAIVCTAIGLLPIQTASGEEILVHAYYSAEVDGTIISPTTIVTQLKKRFSGWTQHSNCDQSIGYITLLARDGNDVTMNLTCKALTLSVDLRALK